jgi:hypothetical protein
MSPDEVPPALRPLAAALSFAVVDLYYQLGWRVRAFPAAPPILAPPPATHHNWVAPGICVRLDLAHADAPADLAALLRQDAPNQVGDDGAFYEASLVDTSQRRNLALALARLADRLLVA